MKLSKSEATRAGLTRWQYLAAGIAFGLLVAGLRYNNAQARAEIRALHARLAWAEARLSARRAGGYRRP